MRSQFDTDGNGTLSARELKVALAGIKPQIHRSLHPLFGGMLHVLDEDGNGDISVTEWQGRSPGTQNQHTSLGVLYELVG